MTPRPVGPRRATVAVVALLLLTVAEASAQTPMAALDALRDGQLRFTFTLRPGVCGQGSNIWRTGRVGRDGMRLEQGTSRDVEYDVECDTGPGRVVIEKVGGVVRDVRFHIGGRWRAGSAATDLGALAAPVAAQLLLEIARTADGKASERAILPATLVDSVTVWRELLRIARDERRPGPTRSQAVFWLGQAAEEPATRGLQELVGEAAVDRDVREQAVFALSQRPRDEGIPALIAIVRTHRDPQLRRRALFWLGQSRDPRALALIEELLTRAP